MNCPICQRETPEDCQEEHHLIPRAICKRNKYSNLPQLEKGKETITVCLDCGNQLHKLFSEKELADNYNTIEKILAQSSTQTWIKWVSNKPNEFNINCKTKKRR